MCEHIILMTLIADVIVKIILQEEEICVPHVSIRCGANIEGYEMN